MHGAGRSARLRGVAMSASVRLDVSTDAALDAVRLIPAEDVETARSTLSQWLDAVEAGEYDAHMMSHVLMAVHDSLEESIHRMHKAWSLVIDQSAALARALDR